MMNLMPKQRGVALIVLVIGLLLVLLGMGAALSVLRSKITIPRSLLKPSPSPATQCTLEAKLCPDGSSVGRTGPQCEFASCPSPKDETANWKTYTSNKYSFSLKYPPTWQLEEHDEESIGTPAITIGNSCNFESGETCANLFIDFSNDGKKEFEQLKVLRLSDPAHVNPRQTIIDGVDAFTTDYTNKKSDGSYLGINANFLFVKNNTFLLIDYGESNRNYNKTNPEWKYKNTFDQILSTFKFLDQESEEKIVTGKVIDIQLGHIVNGESHFILKLENENIEVIYHYGEWPPCKNEKAANQGEQIQKGDKVEVFGKYTKSKQLKVLSTCDSLSYYIQKL